MENIKQKSEVTSTKNDQNDPDEPADFETAITATNFGKFNILLILLAIPSGWAVVFETTTMSYVFPVAQCDLDLTPEMKGALNAACYAGMISGACIWGFLCDTLGRRKLSIIGFFLDAVFVIISAFSQNVGVLIAAKFFGGFIINGPFSALTAYAAEFHCAKLRARIQMVLGMATGSATVVMPLLAWLVIPLDFHVEILDGFIQFHAWNLFLLLCALPSLCSALGFILMPESPKFLMTRGRNDKALKVLQKVYAMNTGKAPETYPIKTLVDEKPIDANETRPTTRTASQAMKDGWEQLKPLFFPPHLPKIILVCLMQTLFLMSTSTIRLWTPQILQAINDYKSFNNGTAASLCTMIDLIKPAKVVNITGECTVNLNNSSVYINSILISIGTFVIFVVAGLIINKLGRKKLLIVVGIAAGCCSFGLYFSQNSPTVTTLVSLFIGLSRVCVNVTTAVVIDLFPTTLRTMTVSLTLMGGRIGALSGNLIFPLLLGIGCAAPFFTIGAAIIASSFLSLILPNTDLKALQ